jgi:hypothetical protein
MLVPYTQADQMDISRSIDTFGSTRMRPSPFLISFARVAQCNRPRAPPASSAYALTRWHQSYPAGAVYVLHSTSSPITVDENHAYCARAHAVRPTQLSSSPPVDSPRLRVGVDYS